MTPELSRIVAADRVGTGKKLDVTVEATTAELPAIAARLAIPGVLALRCRYILCRDPERIVADGELSARVLQDCVATLEPFEAEVAETFRVYFVPAGAETDDDDPEAPDQIGYIGGAIDLGEAAVEQLALALDPYPRRPGAEIALPHEGEESRQPFAALARRRNG